MDIKIIKELVSNEKIIITEHFMKRLRDRGIKINDVLDVLLDGEIIEYYPNDYPYPSCLVLGFSNKVLHIVCGVNNNNKYSELSMNSNNHV